MWYAFLVGGVLWLCCLAWVLWEMFNAPEWPNGIPPQARDYDHPSHEPWDKDFYNL